jgi:DNA gyrase subunit A
MATRDEDYVETVFTASSHDYILFFTSTGRVYRKKGYQIPEASRTSRGAPIVNFVPVEPGEKVQAMLHVREISGDQYIFFATANGTVKRMSLDELKNIRNNGIRALTLDEGDELISVSLTNGSQNILMATANGMAICYQETDVRAMGRTAMGVRGIKLREGDRVIGAGCAVEDTTILSVTENGYGKRTPVEEYLRGGEVQSRGGFGMKNYTVTEKTGAVVDMKIVHGDEDLLMVSDDGTIIRTDVGSVSIYGRAAQGVRLMRVAQDSRVISIACTEKEDEENQPTENSQTDAPASQYTTTPETAE